MEEKAIIKKGNKKRLPNGSLFSFYKNQSIFIGITQTFDGIVRI